MPTRPFRRLHRSCFEGAADGTARQDMIVLTHALSSHPQVLSRRIGFATQEFLRWYVSCHVCHCSRGDPLQRHVLPNLLSCTIPSSALPMTRLAPTGLEPPVSRVPSPQTSDCIRFIRHSVRETECKRSFVMKLILSPRHFSDSDTTHGQTLLHVPALHLHTAPTTLDSTPPDS